MIEFPRVLTIDKVIIRLEEGIFVFLEKALEEAR